MTRMIKRLTALTVAFAMVFSAAPVSSAAKVYAEDGDAAV